MSAPADEPFDDAVDRVLRALRVGEVVTYGEVAAEAGYPGAARAVGRFLATSGGRYAWWRVVTASGGGSPTGFVGKRGGAWNGKRPTHKTENLL